MDKKLKVLATSVATIKLCEQEAIHTPNLIQGHGAVLLANIDSHCVTHASANLEDILGCSPGWAIGRALEEVIGSQYRTVIGGEFTESAASLGDVVAAKSGNNRTINLQAHHTGSHIFVDLQPAMISSIASPMPAVHTVLEKLMHAATHAELCRFAVHELRQLSGFDRVIAYRFNTIGDGQIIAESKIESSASFLGLTYPAADIPPQARRLYLKNRVGTTADFNARPVPLMVDPDLDDGVPIDMSHSALRSVSPIHCQYMRNMGVAADLTISLVHRNELWGMLVCHHNSPRIVGPELRSVAKLLGQVLSLLVGSVGEAEIYSERMARHGDLQTIINTIGAAGPLVHCLAQSSSALLRLVDGDGVIVRIDNEICHFGKLPPAAAQVDALAELERLAGGEIFAADDLGVRGPAFAGCVFAGSGALVLPFGIGRKDLIVWFRPELERNISWGGNPSQHHTIDHDTGQLTPRSSFEAWNESTKGHSASWTDMDLAIAAELRVAVEAKTAAQASANLATLRHFDPLTGLPNRRWFEEQLKEVMTSNRDPSKVGVLFLDLDRFKLVNDSVGHSAGDLLLVQVAERLLSTIGTGQLVSRLGGDEFVILSFDLSHAGIADLAEAIRQALELPFDLNGRWAHISASIGVATKDEVGTLDILQAADMAMYEAKQSGGNCWIKFQQTMHFNAVRKFELDHDLRNAVNDTGQLALVYQPLFDIKKSDGGLIGFEALLRWRHPRLGWIPPDTFIPIAEKSGFIIPLGDWILITAIRQVKTMHDITSDSSLVMTINISVMQLATPGFCAHLSEILRDILISPSAICLEVTESMISDENIVTVLSDVQALGVRVAIDDFGTGYSSLSYLSRLPANIVKLDRSFLEDACDRSKDQSFFAAVVALIHAAGLLVLQEGIETQDQWRLAQKSGIDMVQGFYFGRPLLAPDAVKLACQNSVVINSPIQTQS